MNGNNQGSTSRLLDYARWQSQDALRAAAGARPGTCLRNEDIAPIEAHYQSDIYRNFCGPAGLEHTLGIAEIDPVTQVGELVFLFRSDRAKPFSDAERDLMEQCMAHLVAAWRHRLLWEFASKSERPGTLAELTQRGHAVVDGDGHVHASDAAFGLAMRDAFPAWLGPLLPDALLAMVRNGGSAAQAGGRIFQLLRGTDRHILRLPDPGLAPLSPAELRVATLFAQGLTAQAAADRLNLSPLTVRNHLTAIYEKLGVHSKAELARHMERHGG
jgi:DNA-binding CsgD family transcriptional regulator